MLLLTTYKFNEKSSFARSKTIFFFFFILSILDIVMGPLEITASKNRLRPGDNLEIRCSLPTIRGQISNRNFSWTKMNGNISSNVQPQGTVIQNRNNPFRNQLFPIAVGPCDAHFLELKKRV